MYLARDRIKLWMTSGGAIISKTYELVMAMTMHERVAMVVLCCEIIRAVILGGCNIVYLKSKTACMRDCCLITINFDFFI
jgi:hypothetical protein